MLQQSNVETFPKGNQSGDAHRSPEGARVVFKRQVGEPSKPTGILLHSSRARGH